MNFNNMVVLTKAAFVSSAFLLFLAQDTVGVGL